MNQKTENNHLPKLKDIYPLKLNQWVHFSSDKATYNRRRAANLISYAAIKFSPSLFIWEEYDKGLKVIRVR